MEQNNINTVNQLQSETAHLTKDAGFHGVDKSNLGELTESHLKPMTKGDSPRSRILNHYRRDPWLLTKYPSLSSTQ